MTKIGIVVMLAGFLLLTPLLLIVAGEMIKAFIRMCGDWVVAASVAGLVLMAAGLFVWALGIAVHNQANDRQTLSQLRSDAQTPKETSDQPNNQ